MPVARDVLPLPPMHEIDSEVFRRSRGRGRADFDKLGSQEVWQQAAVDALNSVAGGASFDSSLTPSSAQRAALAHIGEVVAAAGSPDCTPEDAFSHICSAQAGYSETPAKRAQYQRDLLSLPDYGGLVDGAKCLAGDALTYWDCWQERIMQTPSQESDVPAVTPFTDPALLRAPAEYAWFIDSLARRGLLHVGHRRKHSVGVFFVPKSDHRLRMILDTRAINSKFRAPAYCQLPTPAAWAGVRIPAGHPLLVAQMDVDNAFLQSEPATRSVRALRFTGREAGSLEKYCAGTGAADWNDVREPAAGCTAYGLELEPLFLSDDGMLLPGTGRLRARQHFT